MQKSLRVRLLLPDDVVRFTGIDRNHPQFGVGVELRYPVTAGRRLLIIPNDQWNVIHHSVLIRQRVKEGVQNWRTQ